MKKTETFHYLSIAIATLIAIVIAISQPLNNNTKILYEITDLGTLDNLRTYANGINDSGNIVGASEVRNEREYTFIWDKIKGMQQLNPHTNAYYRAYPKKINNAGQIAANIIYWKNKQEIKIGYLWDNNRCVIYRNSLGFNDINDAGQMVGYFYDNDKDKSGIALWNGPDDMLNLTVPLRFRHANRINNAGQIVGQCKICQKKLCKYHACFWDSKKGSPNKKDVIDLGTLNNYGESEAKGINNLGQVVGNSSFRIDLKEKKEKHAFLWDSDRGMQDLGSLTPYNSYALDINDAGQVVGYSKERVYYRGIAFLWDAKNGLQNLNKLIRPHSRWMLSRAYDINENGWIVGRGSLNGKVHAFLLTPISP